MNPRIKAVSALDGFVVELTFTDETVGCVDLSRWIAGHGGVMEPLNDPDFFRRVFVDREAGTIAWPNGVDFCPDVLYAEARQTSATQ